MFAGQKPGIAGRKAGSRPKGLTPHGCTVWVVA